MTDFDLTPYCSTEEFRPYLQKPASRGDWTYALNGHILVRVQRRAEVPEIERFPDGEKILNPLNFSACEPVVFRQFPPHPEDEECPRCNGRGTKHDCADCTCECSKCGGSGRVVAVQGCLVHGIPFDLKYIRLIAGLPGIRIPKTIDPKNPMPFVFEGGIGVLMPLNDLWGTERVGEVVEGADV